MFQRPKYMSDQRLSLFFVFWVCFARTRAAISSFPARPNCSRLHHQTTDTTEGSSSLYCPLTRSLTSFLVLRQQQLFGETKPCDVAFPGLEPKDKFSLCLAHFTENVRHFVASVCPFVLLLALLSVQKRIVELMNVSCCYYLLACACMDLLFLCFVLGEEQKPWFKKKKR